MEPSGTRMFWLVCLSIRLVLVGSNGISPMQVARMYVLSIKLGLSIIKLALVLLLIPTITQLSRIVQFLRAPTELSGILHSLIALPCIKLVLLHGRDGSGLLESVYLYAQSIAPMTTRLTTAHVQQFFLFLTQYQDSVSSLFVQTVLFGINIC